MQKKDIVYVRLPLEITLTKITKLILPFFLFYGISAPLLPEPVLDPDDDANNRSPIGKYISWQKDPECSREIHEILQDYVQKKFRPLGTDIPSFGYSKSRYWFKISVNNKSARPLFRRLYFEVSWLDELNVYLVQDGRVIKTWQVGDTREYRPDLMAYQYPAIGMELRQGQSEIYFSAKSREAMIIPAFLYTENVFQENNVATRNYFGMLYGALALILLYNLILFISSREAVYFYYCLHLSGFLIMNTGYNGFAYYWFWKDYPAWASDIHVPTIFGYQYLGTLFAVKFLDSRIEIPKYHRIMVWFLITAVLFHFITTAAGLEHLAHAGSVGFSAIYAPMIAFIAIQALKKNNRSIRYFAMASFASLFGSLTTTFTAMGVIPFMYTGFRGVDIGFAADAALLSMALGYRFQVLRDEREKFLEKEVAARTGELADLNRNLEEKVNEAVSRNIRQEQLMVQQSKMAAMGEMLEAISHQWKHPLNVLSLTLSEIELARQEGNLSGIELEKKIAGAFRQIEHMADTMDNFRGYLRPAAEKRNFDFKVMIDETRAMYEPILKHYNIRLTVVFHSTADNRLPWYGYANELKHVFLILFENARQAIVEKMKDGFASEGLIHMTVRQDSRGITIKIQDNGGGISPDVAEKIMKEQYITTRGEEGTGIGLYITRSIIENHMNGKISFENREDGACFQIFLPMDS